MTNDSESVTLSISELAELLHTSKSALRYYEKEGLITPERASSSGYRRYSFQSLIELSDVMLYRGLGIPVKDVRALLDSPIAETDLKLDEAEAELLVQLRRITDVLEQVAARRRRIRLYQAARLAGRRFVERPALERLYRFDLGEQEAMGAYLSNPEQVHYAAYFPAADDATTFVDSAASSCSARPLEVVWERPQQRGRWLECLMGTDYSLTGSNNLAEHVAHLHEQGYCAGQAVAEYLTFDWDENRQSRVDYYRTWIEVIEPTEGQR